MSSGLIYVDTGNRSNVIILAGGLVGLAGNTLIDQCYSTVSIHSNDIHAESAKGGLVGVLGTDSILEKLIFCREHDTTAAYSEWWSDRRYGVRSYR
jgi:hypothetical protein